MTGPRRRKRIRVAALAAVAAGLTCGGDPAQPNRPPVAVGSIVPLSLAKQEVVTQGIAEFFSDPDDDDLTYTAVSSETTVAVASISGDSITVTAGTDGLATITITATDPGDLSAEQQMGVKVFPNRPPAASDTLPLHDLFIVVDGAGSDPDTLSKVVIDASEFFSDPDKHASTYTTSIGHDSVARVESVVGSVITTVPVSVDGASLWDSTTLMVTATDPEGLSVSQETQVRVAHADYEAWPGLVIWDDGDFTFPGNSTPFTGCVPMNARTFGDTVYTVNRSEWQVRKGSGWVQKWTTYRELQVCSYNGLPRAPDGTYRLVGELTLWPADTADTEPGDTLRVLRKSENVIEISRGEAAPAPQPDGVFVSLCREPGAGSREPAGGDGLRPGRRGDDAA